MTIEHNVPLAAYTSLGVGGAAEALYTCTSTSDITEAVQSAQGAPLWALGYGSNVVISDKGLPGVTLLVRSSGVQRSESLIIAEAGTWWDDLVQFAIAKNLWGLELMSAVPGSVGAAVVGNIAAYGQAVADTLVWVEVLDAHSHEVTRLAAQDLSLGYRYSAFQAPSHANYIILRAAFALSSVPTKDLAYDAALAVATQRGYDLTTLAGRRSTIVDTRDQFGSLWDYRTPGEYLHTAGSFFRNPMVSAEIAEQVMGYDETGRSLELLKKMNQVHGGDQKRVSAAHVLLAAGFDRGQTWGSVRLHPSHVLKLEALPGATAQNVYDVAQEIIATVKTKLGITLQPEPRFLGSFR